MKTVQLRESDIKKLEEIGEDLIKYNNKSCSTCNRLCSCRQRNIDISQMISDIFINDIGIQTNSDEIKLRLSVLDRVIKIIDIMKPLVTIDNIHRLYLDIFKLCGVDVDNR